jgi:hypothetical protein
MTKKNFIEFFRSQIFFAKAYETFDKFFLWKLVNLGTNNCVWWWIGCVGMQEEIKKITIELGMSISMAIAYEISTLLQCKFFNHASLYQHY